MKKKLGLYLSVAAAALLATTPLVASPNVFNTAETTQVQAAATLPERHVVANWQAGAIVGTLDDTDPSNPIINEAPAANAGINVLVDNVTMIQDKAYAYTVANSSGQTYYLELVIDPESNSPVNPNITIAWLISLESLSGQVVQPTGTVNGTYYKLNLTTGVLEVQNDAMTVAQVNTAIQRNDGTVQPVTKYAYFAPGQNAREDYYGFVLGNEVYYLKADSLATANIKIAPYTNVPKPPIGPTLPTLYISSVEGVVTTNVDNVQVFNDANLTSYTGISLPYGTQLTVDQVAKRADGTIFAYHVITSAHQAAGMWLLADQVTFTAKSDEGQAPQLTFEKLSPGSVIYSHSAAKIYTDPALTQDSGRRLSLSITEWRVFEKAVDENGTIIAYRLGKNQWVKASALNFEKAKSGVFVTTRGTPLYTAEGQLAGKIAADDIYQVFAQRHINGKQALKLGTNAQWIYAENGDYYP